MSDEAPIIQADNADVSITINQKQISEVPNPGNDLTYIAQTTPGAVMNTDANAWMAKFSDSRYAGHFLRFYSGWPQYYRKQS